MRFLILILIPFFANGQYAQFTTGNESAVKYYEVQDSVNNQWVTIATLQPQGLGTNVYQVTLPKASIYVRIKLNMVSTTFYSQVKYLYALPQAIVDPKTSILQL